MDTSYVKAALETNQESQRWGLGKARKFGLARFTGKIRLDTRETSLGSRKFTQRSHDPSVPIWRHLLTRCAMSTAENDVHLYV